MSNKQICIILILFLQCLFTTSGCIKNKNSIEGEWIFPPNRWSEIQKVGESFILQINGIDNKYIITQENGIYKTTFKKGVAQIVYDGSKDEILMNVNGKSYPPLIRYDIDNYEGCFCGEENRKICAEINRKEDIFQVLFYINENKQVWKQYKTMASIGDQHRLIGPDSLEISYPIYDKLHCILPDDGKSYELKRLTSRDQLLKTIQD